MVFGTSFLSFHDLTPQLGVLWASPSILDVLGYKPEELVGVNTTDLIVPEDLPDTSEGINENIKNDLAATQIVNALRHKDGRPIRLVHVFTTCYDFVVSCSSMVDAPGHHSTLKSHSSAMTRTVGSQKEEFDRMRRHHEAFAANSWNQLEPEARVCLILNRFTMNLIIMYASSACEKVFNVDPDDITGKPLLLFLRSDDLAPFVEQMHIVKGTTAIVNMRFWFQSPNRTHEIPCEAIFIGSGDGILVVVRRCKPFFRKYFIEDKDQYDTGVDPSWPSRSHQSYNSTSHSSSLSGSTPPTFGDLSRSGLNRIKIIELEDNKRVRPIVSRPGDDPSHLRVGAVSSLAPAFKEMIIQDVIEDEGDDTDVDIF